MSASRPARSPMPAFSLMWALALVLVPVVGGTGEGSVPQVGLRRNCTAVLVRATGHRDYTTLARRWAGIKAQPWADSVDHVVFIELKRAHSDRLLQIKKLMGGNVRFIDVTAEFQRGQADRDKSTPGIECRRNPTSDIFPPGYKEMCRFWYQRAWWVPSDSTVPQCSHSIAFDHLLSPTPYRFIQRVSARRCQMLLIRSLLVAKARNANCGPY